MEKNMKVVVDTTLFIELCSKRYYQGIEDFLIKNKINPCTIIDTIYGKQTILNLSIIHGDSVILTCMLRKTKNVNVKTDLGCTALHSAARRKDSNAIHELLIYGADPNIQDDLKITPLHIACVNLDRISIKELIRNGAKKNLCNEDNKTPIDLFKESVKKTLDMLELD